MDYILQTSHLGILQQIVRELILARDPDAYFIQKEPDPDPEVVEKDGFGRPVTS